MRRPVGPQFAALPDAAAVAAAYARLEPWITAHGFDDRFPDWVARAANPAGALARFEALLADGAEPRPETLPALLRVLGGSQVLASALLADPTERLLGFERWLAVERVTPREHVERLESLLHGSEDRVEHARRLRVYKRSEILRIGARDLLGLADVPATARELSSLADAAIEAALRTVCAELEAGYGGFRPEHPFRYVVLAMGKLGGEELNFSSDVDLMYLFDGGGSGTIGGPRGQLAAASFAARLAEGMTRMLSEVTSEGFVFRVDLRLRPDGQNGPIVNSLAGALTYYEAYGQTWERAAMLKARPAAGDLDLGAAFLHEMRPFVYRRFLDFGTVEEIQEMKARIEARDARDRLERDVKLGRGGIREVEFIVQMLELVHGGRDERLQTRSTFATLEALAGVSLLDAGEAKALAGAYWFLRDVEHKLQIVYEQQTQRLPDDPVRERLLARRLGYHLRPLPSVAGDEAPELALFRADLARHRGAVRRSFEKLFYGARLRIHRDLDEISSFVRSLENRQPFLGELAAMGFRDPSAAAESLLLLRNGPPHSPASPRRRKALFALAPALFAEIRRSAKPDLALRNLAQFVTAVGARTSFLLLLERNPETLRLLVGLFATSQYLSNFFIRHPELLDSLFRADLATPRKEREVLDRELASALGAASDYEAELDVLRRFRNEEFLRIGVNDIDGQLEFAAVERELSHLAEACLEAALGVAKRALEPRFGPAPPGRFAVLALGRLGGSELHYNSDLDLIFIYESAEERAGTISVHEYFTKLAQRMLGALQLTTREGFVYKIDTRLRPSGSAGPLVSSLAAFREYHRASSALWERQALIRGRGVAGDRTLIAEVERVIEGFVYGRPIAGEDVAEIARMRSRMERELADEGPGRWNLKTGRGGTVDVEFLAQMLVLRHGSEHPAVRCRNTEEALAALFAQHLLPDEDYAILVEGYRFLRRLANRLRLERDQPVEALEDDAAQLDALGRWLGYSGSEEARVERLRREVEETREAIRRIYQRFFGTGADLRV